MPKIYFVSQLCLNDAEESLVRLAKKTLNSFSRGREVVFLKGSGKGIGSDDIVIIFIDLYAIIDEEYVSLLLSIKNRSKNIFFVSADPMYALEPERLGIDSNNFIPDFSKEEFKRVLSM